MEILPPHREKTADIRTYRIPSIALGTDKAGAIIHKAHRAQIAARKAHKKKAAVIKADMGKTALHKPHRAWALLQKADVEEREETAAHRAHLPADAHRAERAAQYNAHIL